jgi:hypothetical protein
MAQARHIDAVHDLFALLAIVAGAGGLFHVDADHLVSGTFGKGAQVPLLPLTRLVVGAHPAVKSNSLSHLIPPVSRSASGCPVHE